MYYDDDVNHEIFTWDLADLAGHDPETGEPIYRYNGQEYYKDELDDLYDEQEWERKQMDDNMGRYYMYSGHGDYDDPDNWELNEDSIWGSTADEILAAGDSAVAQLYIEMWLGIHPGDPDWSLDGVRKVYDSEEEPSEILDEPLEKWEKIFNLAGI